MSLWLEVPAELVATHGKYFGEAGRAWLDDLPGRALAGDPGFELLAALHNRWDDVVATGDVPRAVRRRFDLMTEVLGLDRQRAVAWTMARILQNKLWEVESDDSTWHAELDEAVAAALSGAGGSPGRP